MLKLMFSLFAIVLVDYQGFASTYYGPESTVQEFERDSDPNEGRDYLDDNHGFGVGLNYSGAQSYGSSIFYDYNFQEYGKQLHFSFDSLHIYKNNVSGEKVIEGLKATLGTTLRAHLRYGAFIGYGFEYSVYQFDYENYRLGIEQQMQIESSSSAFLVDLGWLGDDGYYFQTGVKKSAFISGPSAPDFNGITAKSGWRKAGQESWKQLTETFMVYVGFGWYFSR